MATPSPARTATIVAVPIALLVGVLVFWLLGGIGEGTGPAAPGDATTSASPGQRATGPVGLPTRSLPATTAATCRTLVSRLPEALRELHRRPVSAGPEQNAAYGDPALTVECGADPVTFEPTALVYPLSGVCWYAEERPDVTVWTTVDREVPVRVTVPRQYAPPGQWVIEFSEPVGRTVPVAEGGPAGC